MKMTLHGGPQDGLEVEVPEPLPAYLQVQTRRGQARRVHTYALHDGLYKYLATEGERPPEPGNAE